MECTERTKKMKIYDWSTFGFTEALRSIGLSYNRQHDEEQGMKVLNTLARNDLNSGELNILTGVTVSIDVEGTIKWWQQAERYHWFQINMSESVMHSLCNPRVKIGSDSFDKDTPFEVVKSFVRNRDELLSEGPISKEDKLALIYSLPVGYLERARVTTNYLQLMTMYKQRHNHQLQEWRLFCTWVAEVLPMMGVLLEVNGCYRKDTQSLSLMSTVCPGALVSGRTTTK